MEVWDMQIKDTITKEKVMSITKAVCIGAALFVSLMLHVQLLAGAMDTSFEGMVYGVPLDKGRHVALQDAVPLFQKEYGYTPTPEHHPLEVHESDNPAYEYMAASPYYTVYFKGNVVRMSIKNEDTWVEWELEYLTAMGESEGEKLHSEEVKTPSAGEPAADQNMLTISDVFESVNMSYTVNTSVLTEALVLEEFQQCTRIVQKMQWQGITPEYQEDGSILFLDKSGEKIVEILPPFMKDAAGITCKDVHYELVETESGYELDKVIYEKGVEWLQHAIYPVVIDPSMQTFEDAWQSSGLTPYGQYFKNLEEFINPATGLLTVTQTDLIIPGRGLDLDITRVYQTPAVFYGTSPYDYEAPPVDLGKGWSLDFPYVGNKYLHLWGGTVYKISWENNTFENHVGSHFILVKNGNNTYTLTTASGTVCEFDTSGKLTQIEDVDQNSVDFTYESGSLTTITDTIGRTISLSYSGGRLWKITYNSAELEYSYDGNGCLQWMEDFLNRRTSYYYDSGYNYWLLSKIEYVTAGYTTYSYNRFSDSDYYKYYVTDQRAYETNQVRHAALSYTGTFEAITSSQSTVKNESDVTQESYEFTISGNGLVTQTVMKNASGTPIRKSTYTYNSRKEVTQEQIYSDGSTLSYTDYCAYDNWGNVVYIKNAEGHEMFYSYANTSTSGFFVDNTGTIVKIFTNMFSNSTVPSFVHTALIGSAEKQDATYVREAYMTYDLEEHPTQNESLFGNSTSYETFSGTFNEYTGDTSFSIDLTGHTVAGNAVLEITGQESSINYSEVHSYTPDYEVSCQNAHWTQCSWQSTNHKVRYNYTCGVIPDVDVYEGWAYIGPFTHYPGSLGYQSYTTSPSCNTQAYNFTVTTYWKAYPAQVQYHVNGSQWKTVSTNLKNTAARITVPGLTNGENTLYFSESSAQQCRFSWSLYVPVDNSPDSYTTSMQYDTYGNTTSITDAESHMINFTYSSSYGYAYLTEISATIGQDTITTKATYDYYRGWITSIQQPKGVDAGSGYDYLYTYDVEGRITKKEFPLLPGQEERSYLETVYNDSLRTITFIDQLRHYSIEYYDRLGRLTDIKSYTGTYGSGTLYATVSYTYGYNDTVTTATDAGNNTYTLTSDVAGRYTQIQNSDSSTISCIYDDTNNKATLTTSRGYEKVFWYDWLYRLTKVEEEYATNQFAVTTYEYNEIGQLTSLTDAENRTTNFEYHSLFGLIKKTYPDSTYEEYTYSDTGNIASVTDRKGNETAFTYDSLYRLTQFQYEDLSTVSFTYDLNSNVTRMTDNSPSSGDYQDYVYDSWNRLTSATRHISQDSYAVSYQYDTAGKPTDVTYPDGMQILYSYNDLNRTTEIKRYVDGSNDETLMDNIQYNTQGLLTQADYGNGLQVTFSYDSRDRISTLDLEDGETAFLDLDYTYDNASNITQLRNGWRDTTDTWNSDTESYSYDGLDRLTSATSTSWSHTYSWDKVGNRTARDQTTYTINNVNEITQLSDGTAFTYDSNGNRTEKTKGEDTWAYTWDDANRLIEVEENSEPVGEYVYDGEGKRIQATEDDVTTTYVYSGMNVVYEENSTGEATYVYGPTGRFAKRTTINEETNVFYYHTDHLGSTRLVTDSSKNIVSSAAYEPFGEQSTEEGDEDYLFTGKERDVTGLYYYGARYYDPETGTFISRDPVEGSLIKPESLNPYSYCQGNPLKYKDTWGFERSRNPLIDEFKEYQKEQKRRSQENESLEGQIRAYRTDDQYRYKDGWVFLLTPIFPGGGGSVQVAVGYYATLNMSSQSQRIYDNHGFGLIIFIYDEDDNLVDTLFFPFSQLKNEERTRDTWKEIKKKLGNYGIPFDDFTDAIWNLSDYCGRQSNRSTAAGMAVSGGGGGVGVFIWPVGAAALVVVGGIGLDAWKWDHWQDALALLARTVIADVGYKGENVR
jgi:RHS repeat-associated protein